MFPKSYIISPPTEIHIQVEERTGSEDVPNNSYISEGSAPIAIRRPRMHVRFRSRVRITSGIHAHRESKSQGPFDDELDVGSSLSSSPSSSISAPLRLRRDSDDNAAWAPLGRRVGLLSSERQRKKQRSLGMPDEQGVRVNERTPLVGSPLTPNSRIEDPYDSDEEEESLYAQEIDKTFGPLPGRLLNHHVRFDICL
jgi:hypothetical protein